MKNVVITNSAGDNLPLTITNAEIAVGDVELEAEEIDMEAASQEESQKTGQNSAILAIIAMCCVYILRKKQ